MLSTNPRPIEAVHKALCEEWQTELGPIPADQSTFCIGFHWPNQAICDELGETPTFESNVVWHADSKAFTFSNIMEQAPVVSFRGAQKFFDSLLFTAIPYVGHLIPEAGLRGRLMPLHLENSKDHVAGYVGTIVWQGEASARQCYIAHLQCSSRMLFLSRKIFAEAIKKRAWPSQTRCAQLLRQENEEFELLQELVST